MKHLLSKGQLNFIYTLLLLVLGGTANAQTAGTSVLMEVKNVCMTAPNKFEYEVWAKNTGTTTIALRGYSTGLNMVPGWNNGGTITHAFVSRDASLATIPSVSPAYTAATNHLRLTTVAAPPGNEVNLAPNAFVRIATMSVTTSTSFASLGANYNPFQSVQVTTVAGKTQCVVTGYVNTVAYTLYGSTNPLTATSLNVLSASANGSLNCVGATVNATPENQTACGSYTWPVNGTSYTASGTYTYTQAGTGCCPSPTVYTLNLTISCGAVPTVSQWGLILIALISLAVGMVALYRKEKSLAYARQTVNNDNI